MTELSNDDKNWLSANGKKIEALFKEYGTKYNFLVVYKETLKQRLYMTFSNSETNRQTFQFGGQRYVLIATFSTAVSFGQQMNEFLRR